jgi:ABC-2 type transport system permease protein
MYILSLTIGQILGQRRTWVMLLFAAVPILIAVIFRIAAESDEDPLQFFAEGMQGIVVWLILPLTALVFGTAALGQELEDGTAVYLLGKPIPRWRIVVEKAAAAWIVTSAVLVVSIVGTGLILLWGESEYRAIPGFAAAITLGALAYVTLFVCLSVIYSRALIIGLVYVFVWEAIISQIIENARYLSIREFTLGLAAPLADVPPPEAPAAAPAVPLGALESVALLAALAAGATSK